MFVVRHVHTLSQSHQIHSSGLFWVHQPVNVIFAQLVVMNLLSDLKYEISVREVVDVQDLYHVSHSLVNSCALLRYN